MMRRRLRQGDKYYRPHRRYGICAEQKCPACVRIADPMGMGIPQPEEMVPGHLCEMSPFPCHD